MPSAIRPPVPNPPAAVIFDFDGVILDSARMKTDAMVDLFGARNGPFEAAVRQTVWQNGGLTRTGSIAVLERGVFGREPTPERVAELAGRYAAMVDDAVKDCPLIDGAPELLRALDGTPCHLVSGTPHRTLLDTVARKGLGGFFVTVTGAPDDGTPNDKSAVFAGLVATHAHQAERTLIVGDSLTELVGARHIGAPFAGVVPPDVPDPFPAGTAIVRDLHGLAALIGVG
ncbi:HAD family hydrolase [Azospirillum agricola]|uniref:HAD family hydrolase n=1 Tax=Azospirillum agricola TaxID=1720247 RepID=UPI000A0F271B|nr:HAD family hydrolase [Azospirillum agricola]SMH34755.1 Phosphoglycolate phosphatase, HAD superfamily [Azospirillum lipoferum]